MSEYIGIHRDEAGSTWLEKVRTRSQGEAHALMERNDTALQVLPEPIFRKLNSVRVPMGTMIKIG